MAWIPRLVAASSELMSGGTEARSSGMTSGSLPLGNDPDALARVLWELTDREYKRAAPAFLNVKTNTAVRAEEEDKSPDFSKEAPQTHAGEAPKTPGFDRVAWAGEIRRLSAGFRKYPEVYLASVSIQVQNSNSRLVSSEGAAIGMPSASARFRGEVAKLYSAWGGPLKTKRAVVIIDGDGVVRYRHDHLLGLDYQTVDNLKAALDAIPAAV